MFILTFAGVRSPGIVDGFSDFYETTFMETSGKSQVDLCDMALMLLMLAKSQGSIELSACTAIIELLGDK